MGENYYFFHYVILNIWFTKQLQKVLCWFIQIQHKTTLIEIHSSWDHQVFSLEFNLTNVMSSKQVVYYKQLWSNFHLLPIRKQSLLLRYLRMGNLELWLQKIILVRCGKYLLRIRDWSTARNYNCLRIVWV